jgi:hypothetical protein
MSKLVRPSIPAVRTACASCGSCRRSEQCIGNFLTAPAVIQKHQGHWRGASNETPPTIARQRDQRPAILCTEKATAAALRDYVWVLGAVIDATVDPPHYAAIFMRLPRGPTPPSRRRRRTSTRSVTTIRRP